MALNLREGICAEDTNVGVDQHMVFKAIEMNKCRLERLFYLILTPALRGSNYNYYSHVIERETKAKRLRFVQLHSANTW